MRVHVFGNSPSPAVAIYGLRRAAQEGEKRYGSDSRHFVERHFYVDDGLVSLPSELEAIDLLKRTQASLAQSNLRLHKIASNSVAVMQAFPPEDLAAGLKDLGLDKEALPVQRSLGLCWDIDSDTFKFKVTMSDKPFTRRGVLSTVNSLFDPLGFAAPVIIQGRALLRELCTEAREWDAELPADKLNKWETWRKSLQDLSSLHIPRVYTQQSFSNATYTELCLFSDASSWAIGAVAYLRVMTTDGQCRVGFVLGKAKLAPQPEPTIPRLELCGAVLAVEMAELILEELDHKPNAVKFFCDSKVVLGYIYNESKRFFVYVHNRVHRIRQTTSPQQWHYIPTDQNPADLATRSVPASQLATTMWFTGPEFLYKPRQPEKHESFQLVDPENDTDVRPQLTTLATHLSEGLDVFGPWDVVTRRTRGSVAHSKRWAILFTCMSTRAVHIELIESMDSSSCINALRRFFALRGPAKQLRSDRGTNFVGASAELSMRPDDPKQVGTLKYLHDNGCTWEFNPPHASHMGGVWERMIGVARRILDSMLLLRKQRDLTHEVLCTLMAEVCAIINARPLVPISADPSLPVLLTPAMLITQKPGVSAPAGIFTEKDLFKCQWKQVQALANEFWTRWRNEYLHTLQSRRKWCTVTRDLQVGDVVLLKETQSPRNEWPMGLITAAFPSRDGKIRKAEIKTASQGKVKTFLRPIADVILLLPKE
ncbi:hypothetical protein NFI96_016565, partial [Prochilodus magdalenae]